MSVQRARNVVKKLYNYIICVNNSFNIPREERVEYINNLVNKLNQDKYFLESLNIILKDDDKNMLNEPLNISQEQNKNNKITIKTVLQSFQKVSRQNANSRLKSYLNRNNSPANRNNSSTNRNNSPANRNNSSTNRNNSSTNRNNSSVNNNASMLKKMLF